MSSGELLIIALVAVIVFGPKKLPMLAAHLGKIVKYINQLKLKAQIFWKEQLDEQQLQENIRKAEDAEAVDKKQKETLQ